MTPEQVEAFGGELDALSERVIADLGERDADLHPQGHQGPARPRGRRPRAAVRRLFPPAWLAGTAMLALSKILDNMEIGHNVMHGQYDWMGDPALNSQTFEWDTACPSRPVAALPQLHPPHLHQHPRQGPRHRLRHPAHERGPAVAPVLPRQPGLRVPADGASSSGASRCTTSRSRRIVGRRDHPGRQARGACTGIWRKAAARRSRTTSLFPLLTGPFAPSTLAGNADREPDPQHLGVHDHLLRPLPRRRRRRSPTRRPRTRPAAQWYFRQVLGSANITGGKLFHIMTGNLSPPDRAPPVPRPAGPPLRARSPPRCREICERYGAPVQHRTAAAAVRHRGPQDRQTGVAAAQSQVGRRRARPRRLTGREHSREGYRVVARQPLNTSSTRSRT